MPFGNLNIESFVNKVKRQTSFHEFDHTRMGIDDDRYENIEHLNGAICSAYDKETNQKVIIKKLPRIFDALDDAKKVYREIKVLKFVHHDNITELIDVYANSDRPKEFNDVYLVTNYMDSNLAHFIKILSLNTVAIKKITYQLLRGLKYLHSCDIIHRDLKPESIAINHEFDIRITDFGLARARNEEMTGYVATRRYRAPELLLLSRDDEYLIKYTESIDIWAVACIVTEMYKKQQLFNEATNPLTHMKAVISVTGLPSKECLKRFGDGYIEFFEKHGKDINVFNFNDHFSEFIKTEDAIDLLKNMLAFDYKNRFTYVQAISHRFFEGYHEEADEPTGTRALVDDFSKQRHDSLTWKEEILKEIGSFSRIRTR